MEEDPILWADCENNARSGGPGASAPLRAGGLRLSGPYRLPGAGAAHRHAQAVMDEDPIFWEDCPNNARFGGPVAPPLYPTHMFRRPFGAPDPLQARAHDPDFDGLDSGVSGGLPDLEPIKHLALLNGGSEIDFFRYARHGEAVKLRSRYADIVEKETSKGPMLFVT